MTATACTVLAQVQTRWGHNAEMGRWNRSSYSQTRSYLQLKTTHKGKVSSNGVSLGIQVTLRSPMHSSKWSTKSLDGNFGDDFISDCFVWAFFFCLSFMVPNFAFVCVYLHVCFSHFFFLLLCLFTLFAFYWSVF